jgi:hypothetical protein
MPRIKIGDVQLNYEIHDQGEPLVLIPGFRTGLWLWFKQVDTFARKFRTIVFDPRGIGESNSPTGPMKTRTIADDLRNSWERGHSLECGDLSPLFHVEWPSTKSGASRRTPSSGLFFSYDLRKNHRHGIVCPGESFN